MAVLGLLKDQDLHGYELKRRLGEMLGPLSAVSFGSLYPALRRLERAGAVEGSARSSASTSTPMTGSLSGERAALRSRRTAPRGTRGKRVYRITDEGQRMFAELLAGSGGEATEDGRGFSFRLAFARHLSPDGRMRLLERRRAELRHRLDQSRRSAQVQELDTYGRSLVEHSAEATERDISWLDRLIAAERVDVGGPSEPDDYQSDN